MPGAAESPLLLSRSDSHLYGRAGGQTLRLSLIPPCRPELGTRGVWLLWASLLLGITIIAYSPSLTGSLIFGDDVNVRENAAIVFIVKKRSLIDWIDGAVIGKNSLESNSWFADAQLGR